LFLKQGAEFFLDEVNLSHNLSFSAQSYQNEIMRYYMHSDIRCMSYLQIT